MNWAGSCDNQGLAINPMPNNPNIACFWYFIVTQPEYFTVVARRYFVLFGAAVH
ncbi:hypothetical protein [Nostoc flagelliforme]|uniref:hypothetical protein n=1 Tax=Nostoc flagelliforme TaxID=1306274 RepID=UPI0030D44B5B